MLHAHPLTNMSCRCVQHKGTTLPVTRQNCKLITHHLQLQTDIAATLCGRQGFNVLANNWKQTYGTESDHIFSQQ